MAECNRGASNLGQIYKNRTTISWAIFCSKEHFHILRSFTAKRAMPHYKSCPQTGRRRREREENGGDGERETDSLVHFYLRNFGKGRMILMTVTINFIMQTRIFLKVKFFVSNQRGQCTAGRNWEWTWGELRRRVTPFPTANSEASVRFDPVYKWHLNLISYCAAYRSENNVDKDMKNFSPKKCKN